MKPRIDFSYVDASLLNPVSEEIKNEIMTYFSVHPEFKLKFDAACMKLRPMITNCWIDLSEDQETILKNVLANLPSEFTMDEFWSMMKEFDICISKPPVSHLLNFLTYPWNMDSDANLKYFGVELIKL